MRLSIRSEYACLALIELARAPHGELTRIEDISRNYRIPKKYLEIILLSLRKAGYLESRRGVNGGYRLARPPDTITVAEIIRLIDGPLAPVKSASKYFYEHSPLEKCPAMLNLMKDVRDLVAAKMEQTSFGMLTNEKAIRRKS